MSRLKNALLALATALMASASPGSAGSSGDGHGDGHGADHDRARQALEAGEVLPLRAILERVERAYPGQIVEVELEREDGRWEYEIKLLRSGGALVKLRVDARDGSIIGVKGRKDHRQGERRGEAGGEQRGEQH